MFLRMNYFLFVVLIIYISYIIVYNVNSYVFEILLSDVIVLDMFVVYIKKNVMVYVFNLQRKVDKCLKEIVLGM